MITRYREIPIRIYKRVQTGAKIQDGGLNAGFMSVEYHEPGPVVVKSDPSKPAQLQSRIEPIRIAPAFVLVTLSCIGDPPM